VSGSVRARLRRLRFILLAIVAAVVIALGVLAGVAQLALPWIEQHPDRVERWLSQRFDRPVRIGKIDSAWVGGGPVLTLDDVRFGADARGQGAIAIPRAQLAFDLYALFQPHAATTEFRVVGVGLHLVKQDEAWHLRGMDFGSSTPAPGESFSMGALGAFEIRDLTLTIDDPARELHLVLDAPVLRLINRGDTTRVLGRIRRAGSEQPLLDLVADLDINRRSGEIYVGGGDVDLAQFATQPLSIGIQPLGGRGAIQLWARMQDARVDDVRVRVALKDAQLGAAAPVAADAATHVLPRAGFERLAFVARWLRAEGGWDFDLADLSTGDASAAPAWVRVERRGGDSAPRWRAAAAALPLQASGDIAMLVAMVPEGLRRWLYLARPRGTLERAQFAWQDSARYTLQAALQGVGLASVDRVPGVEHIDIDLDGDAQALLLELPRQALRIDYPRVFRKPFLFADFGGDVVARRVDDAWRIETDRLAFEGEGYGGEVRGAVDLPPGRRPQVDLHALVAHAEVEAAKLFWPTTDMSPPAMEWLDRALVGGRVVQGRAALRGDLADWPFRSDEGRMIARAEIADVTLDYARDWPPAEKVHAIATFINRGVEVEADAIETMGNRISHASASIADYDALVLDVAANGEGSGANLLRFLRATPVGERHREQIKDLAIGGKGEVSFALNLPIKDMDALSLDGKVALSGATIDHNRFDLHFLDATGPLRFDHKGLAADQLDVGFRGAKAKLSVAVGGYASDPAHGFEAMLSGTYPAATVFADVDVLAPAMARVPGMSEWTARVAVDRLDSGANPSRLSIESDLRGTTIELPPPLDKAADAVLPFRLDMHLPYAGQPFTARLGQVVAVHGRLPGPGQAFAAEVGFGAATPAMPTTPGVAIRGDMAVLDAGAWLDFVDPASSAAIGGILRGIDVKAHDFVLANRHFDDMRVAIERGADATVLRLDGAALAGTMEIPTSDLAGRGIRATFERIHWPEAPPDASAAGAFTGVAPASLPPLHVKVADFRLGKASFGSAEFEGTPVAGGMHVDKLESRSPNVSMRASGDWSGAAGESHSTMVIDLEAQSLGQMMDALGFSGLIDGGETHATIDAVWPGPPSAFELAQIEGTLKVDVAEGRILDVEPGAGRLFGLFSLTEIPRRLSLDFSDFFRSGLGFNSITGTFRLSGGNAFTDDLAIKSPAADILVTGRTGLRAKDYDQRMRVTPHAGSTLPIVGAIAGGPIGAAAGLVMQGILNKPLGKAVARHYTVTGSWDKPEITQIGRSKPGIGNRESGIDPQPDVSVEGASEVPPVPAGAEPEPEIGPAPWDVLPIEDEGLR
jgi:uncharacterized protein (TIGR02099 family)